MTETDRVQKCTLFVLAGGGTARESVRGSLSRQDSEIATKGVPAVQKSRTGGVLGPVVTDRGVQSAAGTGKGGPEYKGHLGGYLGGPGPGNHQQRGVQSTNVTEMGNVAGTVGVKGVSTGESRAELATGEPPTGPKLGCVQNGGVGIRAVYRAPPKLVANI